MDGRRSQFGFGPGSTPGIIKNILIANGVVFIGQLLTRSAGGGDWLSNFGAVSPWDVWVDFKFWQPFTYMWLHSAFSPLHIVFNMLMLWMFGSPLAELWGEERFLRYYLICGVGAGFLIASAPWVPVMMGLWPMDQSLLVPTLGASGSVMGVILAYAFTWPNRTLMLIFPPMPIKAIWIIPFMLFMEYVSGSPNVSHLGHGGGLIVGWIYLVREGRTPGAPTLTSLQHKWRRYRMRQKIRAVHKDDRGRRSPKDKDDGDGDGPRRFQ